METVTPRQLEILRFIRDFRARSGYSPTLQEIGDQLSLTKVTVFEHVEALERKRVLTRGPKNKARSLQVSPDFSFDDETPTRLPLLGRIAAGLPIEAIEDRATLDLENLFGVRDSRDDTFVLKVAGNSMIDEQIRDGDYVICRRAATAHNGETVVALLEDGQATLKKFYREKSRVRLQPANPAFEPIYVDEVQIQGIVVGVVREL